MPERRVLVPGPDHPITIEPNPARVTVTAGGKVIARSNDALILREASYPPVLYMPREDADMAALKRTDSSTYCPYKGHASYFSIAGAIDAVWSYEAPFDAVAAIKDHLAFYPDRVDSIEEDSPSPRAGRG